jgi:8-oxo-dGTP pyrophosphatase MutT (NUDIX family)
VTGRGERGVSDQTGASDQGGASDEPIGSEGAREKRTSAELGGFTPLGGETVYRGRIVEVRVERFRHADGEEVSREFVHHRGAVAVVAYDAQCVWLERQPREAVDESHLLEIPAGRLDVAGEEPLEAAQRELAEEIGRGAREWEAILSYYVSAGITDECVHLFAATDLYESHADSEENERIELVPWPLDRLEDAIAECRDAKTLIGLFWLARRLNA